MKRKKIAKVDKHLASKVLAVVDKGLIYGLGNPTPGKMCVEAAVSYASGEDHNDKPTCVHEYLAREKINLNDQNWPSNKARAQGLRQVAIAQLGSRKKFNAHTYRKLLQAEIQPLVLAGIKEAFLDKVKGAQELVEGAASIEELNQLSFDDIFNSDNMDYSQAEQKEYDTDDCLEVLGDFTCTDTHTTLKTVANAMVTVLKKMKIPGTKYLYLTERKKRKAKKRTKWSIAVRIKKRKKK